MADSPGRGIEADELELGVELVEPASTFSSTTPWLLASSSSAASVVAAFRLLKSARNNPTKQSASFWERLQSSESGRNCGDERQHLGLRPVLGQIQRVGSAPVFSCA